MSLPSHWSFQGGDYQVFPYGYNIPVPPTDERETSSNAGHPLGDQVPIDLAGPLPPPVAPNGKGSYWDNPHNLPQHQLRGGRPTKHCDARITSPELRAMEITQKLDPPELLTWAMSVRVPVLPHEWISSLWAVRELSRQEGGFGESLYQAFVAFCKDHLYLLPVHVPAPLFGEAQLGCFVKNAWYVSRIPPRNRLTQWEYIVVQFLGLTHPGDKMKRAGRYRVLLQDADTQLQLSEVQEVKLTYARQETDKAPKACPGCGSLKAHERLYVTTLSDRGLYICANQRVERRPLVCI